MKSILQLRVWCIVTVALFIACGVARAQSATPHLLVHGVSPLLWPRPDMDIGVAGFVIEDFEGTNLVSGLSVGAETPSGTNAPGARLSNLFDPTTDAFGNVFIGGLWDGGHGLINTLDNQSHSYTQAQDWGTLALVFNPPVTAVGFSLQQANAEVELIVNGFDAGGLGAMTGLGFNGGRQGYFVIQASSDTLISTIKLSNRNTGDGFLLDHLAFLPADAAGAFTLAGFDPAVWPRPDDGLGVTGYAIEDFEDVSLVPGLQIGVDSAADNRAPGSVLPALFNPTNDAFGTVFRGGTWDGTNGLINTADNQSHGYAAVTNWGDIILQFNPPVTSVGFSVGQADFDVSIVINGVSRGWLGELTGLPFGNAGRQGFVRIDKAGRERISSLRLVNAKNSIYDGILIDHLAFSSQPRGPAYDLRNDWSDTSNPNGPWSYNEGTNPLPHVVSWQRTGGGWTNAQPGWARSEDGTDRLPFWFKSNGSEDFGHDWQAGDVLVHSIDPANGVGNGPGNVTWTSPLNGFVDLSGSVWMGRDIGRSAHWALYLNGSLLTGGDVGSGDPYSRTNPFLLANGSGGARALANVSVSVGDVLKLEVVRTSPYGDFVGVDLAVTTHSGCRPGLAPTNGLVAWWRGEGNTMDSAGTNQGALVGNTSYAPGAIGQGFLFDGNHGGVSVGNSPSLQLQDLTIAAWVRRSRTDLISTDRDGEVLAYGDNGYALGVRNDGRLYFSKVRVSEITTNPGLVVDTNLHHLAVTRASADVRFYLDGSLVYQGSYGDAFEFNSPLAIGSVGDSHAGTIYGMIDEVRVYDRSLSSDEVTALALICPESAFVPYCTNITVSVPGQGDVIVTFCAASSGKLTITPVSPTSVELGWPTAGGAWYLPQTSDEITPSGWQDLGAVQAGTGLRLTRTDVSSVHPHRFYRLLSTEP